MNGLRWGRQSGGAKCATALRLTAPARNQARIAINKSPLPSRVCRGMFALKWGWAVGKRMVFRHVLGWRKA